MENSNHFGKVYLIGAGPGDPGLLTVRGKTILEKADVVVYDRLVSPGVLSLCNPKAKMVDVGKMPTHHKVKQSEINKLLVKFAVEMPGATVARLKGGDPFVFGRGGEEALELVAAGVEFEVVPGVTSAIAVPAYAGIPVSHRGIATSFHIITGHEKAEAGDSLSLDFENLAKCQGTLIFLMGIANMDFIARRLIECGKDPKTPLAFIEKGTTPNQRTVMATLETAGETIVRENVTAPAITIMGGVVELGKTLAWKKNLPLSGKRLVVTRAAKQSSGITARLTALGAEVIETPMIETRDVFPCCHAGLRSGISNSSENMVAEPVEFEDLKNFDILAFTSTNGVESFFTQLLASGNDIRILAGKKIASVGKITEKKLLEYGIRCDYVPKDHTGEGLGLLLREVVDDESRILLLQGNLADDTLLKLLPKATRWTVYETLPVAELPEWKCEAIASADAIVFASSSAVENFCAVIPAKAGISFDHCPHTSFCIGRMTEASAKKHGFETVTSDETTMDSLVKKIVKYYTMGENA
ncbi:uroporphyrinogen III methyltransferase / synthase [Fibrobacter sp. UWB16]|uniref:uroporphyrinogen-III C-methyltransferase n=1 Tax=unclassified Fibrobacter TaxID=2634177 RepID=UPI000B52205A|nr:MULTISPECIES: uroporphyrinogen-III C-methyltransferase [unclassified Fibrobacter]OWV16700.1 uroporphyrinogen-III C-methyltransferase [Fibrobacter sp. UWB3]SOD14452.1 uroporphyrinogen III methyltransferase / synthase [Fibrobacter sp. UWB16]